jgi:hypothetical protein
MIRGFADPSIDLAYSAPMTPLFWLGVVALLVFSVVAVVLVRALKNLRANLAELLGSLATSNWRIRDELAAINKRQDIRNDAPQAENQSRQS